MMIAAVGQSQQPQSVQRLGGDQLYPTHGHSLTNQVVGETDQVVEEFEVLTLKGVLEMVWMQGLGPALHQVLPRTLGEEA